MKIFLRFVNELESRSIPFLFILILPAIIPLFSLYLPAGHDAQSGLLRVFCFREFAFHGQWLPRWIPSLNMGYGSPMFNFYPPFFYAIASLCSLITHHVILAVNLTCMIFYIVSVGGMYLLAREWWGNRGGIFSAFAYAYAPYHLQDLYVRGAFAEFSSFALFPIIFFCYYKVLVSSRMRYVCGGVFGVSALFLTHNIMSMLFMPALILFVFFICKNNRKKLILSLLMIGFGLLISSFFWLPAIIEKKYLDLSYLLSKLYDFNKNFVSIEKLLRFPFDQRLDDHQLSYQIGFIIVILALLPLISLSRLKNEGKIKLYLFLLSLTLIFLFLMFPLSTFIWQHNEFIRFVQFSWRILAIVSFLMCILAGSYFFFNKNNNFQRNVLIVAMVAVILSSLNFLHPKKYVAIDENQLKLLSTNTMLLGEGEYTPKWIKIPILKESENKLQFVLGSGLVTKGAMLNPVNYKYYVLAKERSLMVFQSYYFPGWDVKIDGKSVDMLLDNPWGIMSFAVDSGEHEVEIKFKDTSIRNISNILSLIAFMVFIVIVLMGRKLLFM